MSPLLAKKRFGIATFSGLAFDNTHGPLRDTAIAHADDLFTPSDVNLLNRVWLLLIHCFTTKQRSRRRIQLSKSLKVVGVSANL
jgi:hypothetical protein